MTMELLTMLDKTASDEEIYEEIQRALKKRQIAKHLKGTKDDHDQSDHDPNVKGHHLDPKRRVIDRSRTLRFQESDRRDDDPRSRWTSPGGIKWENHSNYFASWAEAHVDGYDLEVSVPMGVDEDDEYPWSWIISRGEEEIDQGAERTAKKAALAAEARLKKVRVKKHGDEHDEKHHGNWARGRAGETSGGETGSSALDSSTGAGATPSQGPTPAPPQDPRYRFTPPTEPVYDPDLSGGGIPDEVFNQPLSNAPRSQESLDAASDWHENYAQQEAGGPKPISNARRTTGPRNLLAELQTADSQALEMAEPTDLVSQVTQDAMMKGGARLQHIMNVAGLEQMSNDKTGKRGIDTMGEFGNWGEDGKFLGYTKDRANWQSEILRQMEAEQIAENDGRAPKAEKRAVIMAGLPGSGKSFVLKNKLGSRYDLRDFITINADAVKEHIIADPSMPQVEDLEGMELASMAHEESSWMAKAWEADAMKRGMNIALDITAANGPKVAKRIDKLQSLGYTVDIVHVDVTPDEALASALRRSVESKGVSEGHIGRPVPPGFIRSMAVGDTGLDAVNESMEIYGRVANGNITVFRNFPLTQRDPQLLFESTSVVQDALQQAEAEDAA